MQADDSNSVLIADVRYVLAMPVAVAAAGPRAPGAAAPGEHGSAGRAESRPRPGSVRRWRCAPMSPGTSARPRRPTASPSGPVP